MTLCGGPMRILLGDCIGSALSVEPFTIISLFLGEMISPLSAGKKAVSLQTPSSLGEKVL